MEDGARTRGRANLTLMEADDEERPRRRYAGCAAIPLRLYFKTQGDHSLKG
jgi:hypothetical protein